MDPKACFYAWHGAVLDGELDLSADAEESFTEWREKGGFAPTLENGWTVLRVDTERDRFLVEDMTGAERWVDAFSVSGAELI